jgi:hypothetical protein
MEYMYVLYLSIGCWVYVARQANENRLIGACTAFKKTQLVIDLTLEPKYPYALLTHIQRATIIHDMNPAVTTSKRSSKESFGHACCVVRSQVLRSCVLACYLPPSHSSLALFIMSSPKWLQDCKECMDTSVTTRHGHIPFFVTKLSRQFESTVMNRVVRRHSVAWITQNPF